MLKAEGGACAPRDELRVVSGELRSAEAALRAGECALRCSAWSMRLGRFTPRESNAPQRIRLSSSFWWVMSLAQKTMPASEPLSPDGSREVRRETVMGWPARWRQRVTVSLFPVREVPERILSMISR